jgi:hypothetical protein
MELQGIIVKKLDMVSGASANGGWQKREFILKTEGDYPKDVCFNTWGAKVDDLSNIPDGSKVRVGIELSSREYNGRWYTEARAWKIEVLELAQQTTDVDDPTLKHEVESNDSPF